MKYQTCKECGQPIKFLQTPAGKYMPCDTKAVYYRPQPDGPERVVNSDGEVVRCIFPQRPQDGDKVGLIPHWATCPAAASFRKKEKQNTGQMLFT